MEAGNFFGFDDTQQAEDDCYENGPEDQYDALNDETFGASIMEGDWEETHEHMASLRASEREALAKESKLGRPIGKTDDRPARKQYFQKNNLQDCIDSFSFDKSLERRRLFERRSLDSPVLSSSLGNGEFSCSPGGSIWSPTQGPEAVRLGNKRAYGINFQAEPKKNEWAPNSSAQETLHQQSPYSMKTVEDLEQELRRHHFNNESTAIKTAQALTVGDLEEQMKLRNAAKNSYTQQGQNSQMFHSNNHPTNATRGAAPHQLPNASAPLMGQAAQPHQDAHQLSSDIQAQMRQQSQLMYQQSHRPPHPQGNQNFNDQSKGSGPRPPGFHQGQQPFDQGMQSQRQSGHNWVEQQQSRYQQNDNPNVRNFPRQNQERRSYDHQDYYERYRNNGQQHDGSNRKVENVHGGNRTRRDSEVEWEDWALARSQDEYAGLMTPKERGWLRNIQNMQLQTENPYQDDYYFVMHKVKQQMRGEENVIEIDGLQLLLPDKGKEGKEYMPPQLENSLGKLQVVSVNAPRKIIDLQVVNLDQTSMPRDLKKHRYLLIFIENLYRTQIELDDLQRKIRALPDCPTRDLFRSKCRHLVDSCWHSLTNNHQNFVQLLCIKKGKSLVARFAVWVGEVHMEHLLATVIQNLTLLCKKDIQDKALNLLWPAIDRFLSNSSIAQLTALGVMMEPQLKPLKNNFVPAVNNKFGLSLIFGMLIRGEILWPDLQVSYELSGWHNFLLAAIEGLSEGASFDLGKDSATIVKQGPLPSVSFFTSSHLPILHIKKANQGPTKPTAVNLERATDFVTKIEEFMIANKPALPDTEAPAVSATNVSNQFRPFPNSHFGLREQHSRTSY